MLRAYRVWSPVFTFRRRAAMKIMPHATTSLFRRTHNVVLRLHDAHAFSVCKLVQKEMKWLLRSSQERLRMATTHLSFVRLQASCISS